MYKPQQPEQEEEQELAFPLSDCHVWRTNVHTCCLILRPLGLYYDPMLSKSASLLLLHLSVSFLDADSFALICDRDVTLMGMLLGISYVKVTFWHTVCEVGL